MFTKVCEKEIRSPTASPSDETMNIYGNSWQNETCERRDEDLAGRASFLSSRRLLDSHRRDNMMNRIRTALVSVTAVAVAMMVLGSNARAQSVSSLEKRASSLENQGKSLVGLLNRLEKRKPQTLTLYNKELSDFSMIQVNIHALVANQSAL